MTLNTSIHINTSLDHEALFDLQLRAILTAGEALHRYDGVAIERMKAGDVFAWSTSGYTAKDDRLATTMGQGLPAITECERRADGSPYTYEYLYGDFDISDYADYDVSEEQIQADREHHEQDASAFPEATYRLSYDTGYFYEGPDGTGCSTLHARAIAYIHANLPEGSTLHWHNEYTGEWFEGLDGFEDFAEDGARAADWFKNIVVPAITNREII